MFYWENFRGMGSVVCFGVLYFGFWDVVLFCLYWFSFSEEVIKVVLFVELYI